jgi:hypothetical protein
LTNEEGSGSRREEGGERRKGTQHNYENKLVLIIRKKE